MADPSSLSLDGQGNPLPEDFTYKGVWLLEPQLFLYRPYANKTAGDRELTPVVSAGQNWSYGINAMQLAFALRSGWTNFLSVIEMACWSLSAVTRWRRVAELFPPFV
jgi:hypothetical protein